MSIADFGGEEEERIGVNSKVNEIIRIVTNNWKARAATTFSFLFRK